jgi:hypothetical protein
MYHEVNLSYLSKKEEFNLSYILYDSLLSRMDLLQMTVQSRKLVLISKEVILLRK